jgi:TMEM175 potassium channel family protein
VSIHLYRRGSSEFDRGVSFFDAVYGFAITLLVTTVHIPGPSAWRDLHTLLSSDFGSQISGFVLSFLVIALFWRLNYRLIGTMNGMSSRVVLANIGCVFFIILIPLTTQAMNSPDLADRPLATSVYAANIALASLAQSVMWQIARRSELVKVDSTRASSVVGLVSEAVLPLVFLASIPIAYLANTHVAQYSWAALLVLMPLFSRLQKRLNHGREPLVVPPHETAE